VDVPLNVNFALSRPKPVVVMGAVFSRNVTNRISNSSVMLCYLGGTARRDGSEGEFEL